MIRSNAHTHSNFSDGRDSAEDMVKAALERGFTSLGFTDHSAAPYDSAGMRNEAAYRAEVNRLKEVYRDQIEIRLGYEHDYGVPDADLTPYEYIIESVHFLDKDGELASIDTSQAMLQEAIDHMFGGDPYAMCKHYFGQVCDSMSRRVDIVGHIELASKFNEGNRMFDIDDPRYLNPAREVLKLAVEKDLLIEVNTGAMSRGYRTEPYPCRRILQELHDMGGRVIVTSDCHRAEWIDFAFDQAYQLVRDCGFREAYVLRNGEFVPEAI